MTRRLFPIFLFLLLLGGPDLRATTPVDSAQAQLDQAHARLEHMREAYANGAISKHDLDEAEEDVRQAERRLRDLSAGPHELTAKEAASRVGEARYEFEKASAKAKKLQALHDIGAVSRNDYEASQAAAAQAEIYLKLNEELARRIEQLANMPRPETQPTAAGFSISAFFHLQDAYFHEFHHALPVSAFGPSETHEKMGFDHEGRVDVALNPDSVEGRWLISQLELRHIPFIAFRTAVPGKATGAHIHMGFPSPVVGRDAG